MPASSLAVSAARAPRARRTRWPAPRLSPPSIRSEAGPRCRGPYLSLLRLARRRLVARRGLAALSTGARRRVVRAGLGHGIAAALGQLVLVPIEAGNDTAAARLHVRAQLLDIVLAGLARSSPASRGRRVLRLPGEAEQAGTTQRNQPAFHE